MSNLFMQIRSDQRQQWQAGRAVLIETYLSRHPELESNPEIAIDLIYSEILLREEFGDVVNVEDYCRRFPQYAVLLRRQLAVDGLLREEWLADGHDWATLDTLVEFPEPAESLKEVSPSLKDFAAAGLGPGLATVPPGELAAPGPVIPGYQIVRKLGQGAVGVVYEAVHLTLNRRLALKILRTDEELFAENCLELFRREAETAAGLRHPCITEIYDFGTHQGRPYFTMELAEGGNLHRRVKHQPLPPDDAAVLVEQLALAMHAVHQQGIVHRDLKPGNILLTGAGAPKIADFGLAKWLEGSTSIAQSGAIIGTACYMAPEQAEGKNKEVGPRADVYALGAILYEVLTGQPPFRGSTLLDILSQVRCQAPIPPRRLQPQIDRDLELICLKCLSKSPRDRFPSAAELADRLRRFLEHKPIPERPRRWNEKALRQGKGALHQLRARPRTTACLAGLLLLAVLVLPVSRWLKHIDARTAAEQTLARGETYLFAGSEAPGPFRPLREGLTPPLANPEEGCFSVEAVDTALFELIADPQTTHYKFSMKVRHEVNLGETSGKIGLFFGHENFANSRELPLQHCFSLYFADLGIAPQTPNWDGLGQGRVNLVSTYYENTQKGLRPLPELPVGKNYQFHPASPLRQPLPWRSLAVEVSPTVVKLFWGESPDGLRPLAELPIQQLEQSMKDLQTWQLLLRNQGLPQEFRPRLGLGLVVARGRASFKDVELKPLPQP